jgi:hypothetical protein
MLNKIMSKIKNWVKNKTASLSMALANVEKNALNQKGESLESDVNMVRRHTEGQLADSLMNGVITQEVIDLRWRTYKILKETQNHSSKIVGYDKSGYPILENKKVDLKKALKKVKLDKTDDYQLEMVIKNEPTNVGVTDVMDSKFVKAEVIPIVNKNEKTKEETATLGTISGQEYFSVFKPEKPIKVDRDFFPKFMLENFTERLNVRTIDEKKKLLEFYVSKYVKNDDMKSKLFINEIKKAMVNTFSVNFLDIKKVDFITYNCLGVSDFLYYEYDKLEFDKITEFDGYYLIKYKAENTVNGEPILDKFKVEELDKKYENKERK